MKERRYTEAQILPILWQAKCGMPVAELCRAHGMSSASFYQWRSKVEAQSKIEQTLHHGKGSCGGQVKGN